MHLAIGIKTNISQYTSSTIIPYLRLAKDALLQTSAILYVSNLTIRFCLKLKSQVFVMFMRFSILINVIATVVGPLTNMQVPRE